MARNSLEKKNKGKLRKTLSQLFFPKKTKNDPNALKLLSTQFAGFSGYTPMYTSHDEGIYELGLCRACVHRKASESSKATPTLTQPNKRIEFIVRKKPNPFMTASQFYYRLRTIFEVENNAFIVPIENEFGETVGIFPVVPSTVSMREKNNKVYMIYQFGDGSEKAIEYSRCGHLRKHQYKSDFFGDDNSPFRTTADLVNAQERGSRIAIENGSALRYIGKLNTQVVGEEDFKEQQQSLSMLNLKNNDTGLFLYDSRWETMEPIEQKPILLDAEQKKAIDNSVYTYWGINEDILQNCYTEDNWNAFYESEIEPFFIQVGEVLSNMFYSDNQLMNGNEIVLTSDRLQYASNTTKIQIAKEGFDRGLLSTNDALRILNMAPIPDPEADRRFIRLEYVPADDIGKEVYDDNYRETDDLPKKPDRKANDDDESGSS